MPAEQVSVILAENDFVEMQEVNWAVLATNLGNRSVTAPSLIEARGWVALTVEILSHLSRQNIRSETSAIGCSFEQASFLRRAWLIKRFGPDPADALRQLEPIRRWFLHSTWTSATATIEEVRALNWRVPDSMDIDRLQRLRRLKNRLGVCDAIQSFLEVGDPILEWLSIRRELP